MSALSKIMEIDDLLPKIVSTNSITKKHFDFISERGTPRCEKAKRFLVILLKRSQRDYDNVLSALESTGQGHIARVLSEGGG